MSNDEICFQLRCRQKRLGKILDAQTGYEARELIAAEINFVTQLLEYRSKFGGLVGLVIPENMGD